MDVLRILDKHHQDDGANFGNTFNTVGGDGTQGVRNTNFVDINSTFNGKDVNSTNES